MERQQQISTNQMSKSKKVTFFHFTGIISQVAPVLFYAVLLLSLFMRVQNDITEPTLQVRSKDE